MGFVLGLLAVISVVGCILLMFVVLLQEPKGGGIAAALGGSGMEAIGPAVGGVNRFTGWLAAVWMASCFLHSVLMGAHEASIGLKPAPASTSTDKGGEKPPEKPADGGGGEPKNGDEKK